MEKDALTSLLSCEQPIESNEETKCQILPTQSLPSDTPAHISHDPSIPSISASAVLGESSSMPSGTPICRGFDFNSTLGNDDMINNTQNSASTLLDNLLSAMSTVGFQATNLSLAISQIKQMRSWRLSQVPLSPTVDESLKSPEVRSSIRARIFFSYTSNQISCGQRETIRFLVEHKMVDVLCTTAGGIEEDLIKCFEPTFIGDFKYDGKALRRKGLNRIGNLVVPNKNYCKFEDWLAPLLNKMHDEQNEAFNLWRKEGGDMPENLWTPSRFIRRLGKEIDNTDSVLYWAYKNNIPVFCPALTDGSIGDMLYFHSYKRSGFILDINKDIRLINDLAVRSHATGMIIIGGGVVKHHVCNANLMRNGADWSVYLNTASEFDGSDSGASPDEAISWGKIRMTAKPVKVHADATIVFPLIVSQTFAKDVKQWKIETEGCVCWID